MDNSENTHSITSPLAYREAVLVPVWLRTVSTDHSNMKTEVNLLRCLVIYVLPGSGSTINNTSQIY